MSSALPFQAEPAIATVAEAYALDAVDAARENFGVRLDWSIESIQAVEAILTSLHDALPRQRPSDQTIEHFAKAFGSYLGEVIRRTHGGSWGWVTLPHGRIVGLQLREPQLELWPWARVLKRLKNGSEDNVWHYYQLTVLYDQEHPRGA